ncbi:MAG: SRPBCC domain-containing protein [Rhodobacteraceae bacterium]|nr:SRPBCC domain-containing protein [Paracoccaceae bacterium]
MATLTMERHFPAPPAKVFTFITQTDNLLLWWGPDGTTIPEHDLDFSRLGPWSALMVGPQGHGATVGGDVIAIDPPNFVELTLSFAIEDGQRGPESIIRFECIADDAGTRFVLTQTGLDPAHIEDMRTKGWNAAFARLEHLITT